MSIDVQIAMIRGLLLEFENDYCWKQKLYNLLRFIYKEDQLSYTDILLPYLKCFGHIWHSPFSVCKSFEDLESWTRLIPFVLFELRLRMNNCLSKELSQIIEERYLQNVQILNLNSKNISDEEALYILTSKHFVNLRALHIEDRNVINERFVNILTEAVFSQQLRYLCMSSSWMGVQGAKIFSESIHLPNLEVWKLDLNNLGTEGVETILEGNYLSTLKSLHLRQNKIDDKGLEYLSNIEKLLPLQNLYLGGNLLTNEGVRHIAESPYLKNIKVLELIGNSDIDDKAIYHIIKSKNFYDLEELYLGENKISEEGWLALIRSQSLSKKVRLQIVNKLPIEKVREEAKIHNFEFSAEMDQRDILQSIWSSQV